MDYYNVLGLSRNANDKDIKQAYRKLAMQHHPDKGGDGQKFAQINEAYNTLKDPQKRQQYDNPQHNREFNFNTANMHTFNDMFGDMFNNPRQRATVQIAVEIALEDSLQGKNLIVTYQTNRRREETVNISVPVGAMNGDQIRFQGLGNEIAQGIRGDLIVTIRIKKHHKFEIDGINLHYKQYLNCFDLITGTEIVVETLDRRNLKVNVPAATQNGRVLSLAGQGLPDRRTGRKGNLYIIIHAQIPKIKDKDILQDIENIKNKL